VPADKLKFIPTKAIKKENVDEFWADLKKKKGKA
jgi:hypothetical protein